MSREFYFLNANKTDALIARCHFHAALWAKMIKINDIYAFISYLLIKVTS